MSVHETRKTVATAALAVLLVASPALQGGTPTQAGFFQDLLSWLHNPVVLMADALGVSLPQAPGTAADPSAPATAPVDDTDHAWSIDPNGGPR